MMQTGYRAATLVLFSPAATAADAIASALALNGTVIERISESLIPTTTAQRSFATIDDLARKSEKS